MAYINLWNLALFAWKRLMRTLYLRILNDFRSLSPMRLLLIVTVTLNIDVGELWMALMCNGATRVYTIIARSYPIIYTWFADIRLILTLRYVPLFRQSNIFISMSIRDVIRLFWKSQIRMKLSDIWPVVILALLRQYRIYWSSLYIKNIPLSYACFYTCYTSNQCDLAAAIVNKNCNNEWKRPILLL
jgi:hypothetical protein